MYVPLNGIGEWYRNPPVGGSGVLIHNNGGSTIPFNIQETQTDSSKQTKW